MFSDPLRHPASTTTVAAPSAAISRFLDQTNHFINPTGRGGTANWSSVFGSGGAGNITTGVPTSADIVAREGAAPPNYLRLNVTSATSGIVMLRNGNSAATNAEIRPDLLYTASAWVYQSSTSTKTSRLWFTFKSKDNGNLRSTTVFATLPPNTWTKVSATLVAPSTAVGAAVEFGVSNGMPAGTFIGVTGAVLAEGAENNRWFDGSRPNEAGYLYEWTPDAHTTPSTRVATVERPPELFTWRAGVNAWDFLEPLTASAGLRLFCDEQRRWHLVNPAEFVVPGRFSARVDNTVEATDTIDAEDDQTGYTGVVAYFSWTDAKGVNRREMDTAGTAGKVKVLEFDRAYTKGVAEAHLRKITGQNRQQDVTVATDYTVRPGQEVQIDLPGTLPQLGSATRVNFELTSGLMTLQSGGLRETPDGAIDLLAPTIDDLPGTIDDL